MEYKSLTQFTSTRKQVIKDHLSYTSENKGAFKPGTFLSAPAVLDNFGITNNDKKHSNLPLLPATA